MEVLLQRLGLSEAAGPASQSLSGGQRSKLELARAIVVDSGVLFLDEATLWTRRRFGLHGVFHDALYGGS